MTGDIVNTLVLIELGLNIIAICFVPDQEGNFFKVAFTIRKLLGQVQALGVDVAAVLEGIIVIGIGALPGQLHFVRIAGIAIDYSGVTVD